MVWWKDRGIRNQPLLNRIIEALNGESGAHRRLSAYLMCDTPKFCAVVLPQRPHLLTEPGWNAGGKTKRHSAILVDW